MLLKEIKIDGFRNLGDLSLPLNESFNLFLGRNAQGKSNFLEAIYSLGLGRSYRTVREEQVIAFKSDFARIEGLFSSREGNFIVEIAWDLKEKPLKKSIRINGTPLSRLADLVGQVPMVMFAPDDLNLVRGEPSDRRRYIDLLCGRLHPSYVSTLREYRKMLELRNKWLKLPYNQRDPVLGEIYSDKLIELGSRILFERLKAIEALKPLIIGLFNEMFELEAPVMKYKSLVKEPEKSSPEEIRKAYEEAGERLLPSELEAGYTMAGPHRDDFSFQRDERSMRHFASFGEIRSAAVVLKMAEAEVISKIAHRDPIVIIDDSLNEFDPERVKLFVNYLSNHRQIFYATTDKGRYLENLEGLSTYRVEKGMIAPEQAD